MAEDALDYYVCQTPITDPGEYAELFEGLPTEVPTLRRVVQGILIHVFWAERYGVTLSEERSGEVQLRWVKRMLRRVRELDDRPLTDARPPEARAVGNCRDFSVMLCAMLRHQGVPARARCGFGAYFTPGKYEDHWVCEYWRVDEERWVLVDAQLDELQCEALRIGFDPCDVPRDQFLPGGRAWQLCRSGEADPDDFGIFDMHGLWFVLGDLGRDVASLNRMELLPWDGWGIVDGEDRDYSEEEWDLLDRAAALSLADNAAFPELRAIYENDARLRVPSSIQSYTEKGAETVDLTG